MKLSASSLKSLSSDRSFQSMDPPTMRVCCAYSAKEGLLRRILSPRR